MANVQLTAELFQNLGIIAEDENLLKRAVKYLKRLASKKEDDTLMSKEEFFARVDKAREHVKRGEVYRMKPNETLDEFLKRVP